MTATPPQAFLEKLQYEAKLQARLEHHKVLPDFFGGLARFIGLYPWQTLLVSSALTALIWELW